MIKHRITLRGSGLQGHRISGFLLREILGVICDGTKGALRLRLEGRSSAPGSDPSWLEAAADFEVTGIEDGSTVLTVESLPIAEAVPEKFKQLSIFVDHTSSAFKMFEQSLDDAVNGREDSELYDDQLLRTYSRFGLLLGHDVESIEIRNGKPKTNPVVIYREQVEKIKSLRHSTPRPQAVRLAGRLDTIRHSDKMFELVTRGGEKLRGIAPSHWHSDELARLWGTNVTIDGMAIFRPSACVLRIEATEIMPAKEKDLSFWSKIPAPTKRLKDQAHELRQSQSSKTGLNKIWGQWPGDETEEEFQKALQML